MDLYGPVHMFSCNRLKIARGPVDGGAREKCRAVHPMHDSENTAFINTVAALRCTAVAVDGNNASFSSKPTIPLLYPEGKRASIRDQARIA
jgi:hypothetical protein